MNKKHTYTYNFKLAFVLCIITIVASFAQTPCTNTSINNLSPLSGPAGTWVTLSGTGFSNGAGTTSVKFNGVEATSFTVVSDTQIVAIAPATGNTGVITAITNGCQATGTPFTYLQTNCASTTPELYISELYDHVPGSYGVIELYNPSPTNTITFNDQYILERYGDIGAATPSNTLTLPGSIGPESTYLILTYGTGTMGCDVTTQANMGSGINDNDEFKLRKNGVVIDYAHAPDETGYTVIRKPNAVAPNITYSDNDWNFFGTQSCTDLGNHTADPLPAAVTVTAQPQDDTVCVGQTASFTVTVSNTAGATYQWKMLNASGVWVNVSGSGYSGAATATLTVSNVTAAQNNSQFYCEVTTPGCIVVSEAVQLTVETAPQATVAVTAPTCSVATGTITVTTTSAGTFTYSLNDGTFQSSATFTGQVPGTYTVTVQNAAGCTTTLSNIVIPAAPVAPAVASTTVTQPTCAVATGTIVVDTPAGMQYSINGGAYQTSATFDNLTPGSYTITVQNAAGCTTTLSNIVIPAAPVAPAIASTTVTQPTCAVATGTIVVDAPAGMQYSLNGGAYQSAATFENLLPGSYTITVQNADGCTSTTAPIVINAAPAAPAVATTIVTQPTCAIATGTIEITAPAGLQYSLNGGAYQTSATFENLLPGSYTITVQNADGCTSTTAPIVINAAPAAPAVATTIVTQPTCTIATGTIEITAPAGLQYSLNGGAYQTSATFDNLTPGSYTITVQNAEGCTSVTAPIVINAAPAAPAVATTTVTQPTCAVATGTIVVDALAGMQYSLNGGAYQSAATFENLLPGSYTITVQNADGCTSVTSPIVINTVPNAPAIASTTVTQPTCAVATGTIVVDAPAGMQYSLNGGAYQTSATFANLAEGNYTITVQNAEGCTSVTAPIVIDAAPAAPAVATTAVIQPTCAEPTGTIEVTAPAGLQYSINGTDYQTSPVFENLDAGNYAITVQNAEGCTSVTAVITINATVVLPEVALSQGCEQTISGQNYLLTGSVENNSFDPATADYEWRISGSNSIIGTQETFNVTEYAAGNNLNYPVTFELTVTTNGGCENTASITVDGIFCEIPRGISPNNDQMNDRFDLTGLNARNLKIFNRYGLEVYSRANYSNEWYGQTDKGDELPTGTYFYVIELTGSSKTGWVYINRQN